MTDSSIERSEYEAIAEPKYKETKSGYSEKGAYAEPKYMYKETESGYSEKEASAEPTCIQPGCLKSQSQGMSRLCMDHFLIQQHAIMDKIKQKMNKEL